MIPPYLTPPLNLPSLWRQPIRYRSSLYAEYASCVGPRNTRRPLALKNDFIWFVFVFGQRLWKHEWPFILMRHAVEKSCNVNVVKSLARDKEKLVESIARDYFSSAFETEWNTDKCISFHFCQLFVYSKDLILVLDYYCYIIKALFCQFYYIVLLIFTICFLLKTGPNIQRCPILLQSYRSFNTHRTQ